MEMTLPDIEVRYVDLEITGNISVNLTSSPFESFDDSHKQTCLNVFKKNLYILIVHIITMDLYSSCLPHYYSAMLQNVLMI